MSSRDPDPPVRDFSSTELSRIQRMLSQPLKRELVKTRSGHGGMGVQYIDGATAISLCNEIFGFDGWHTQICEQKTEYCQEKKKNSDRWFVGCSAIVRVELKNGTFHEDLGFGEAINTKGRGMAIQKAKKEAVTDAIKRAARQFGNGLGNCIRLDWYKKAYKKGEDFQGMQKQGYEGDDALENPNEAGKKKKPKPPPPAASPPAVAPPPPPEEKSPLPPAKPAQKENQKPGAPHQPSPPNQRADPAPAFGVSTSKVKNENRAPAAKRFGKSASPTPPDAQAPPAFGAPKKAGAGRKFGKPPTPAVSAALVAKPATSAPIAGARFGVAKRSRPDASGGEPAPKKFRKRPSV